jgi:hypothetical protein
MDKKYDILKRKTNISQFSLLDKVRRGELSKSDYVGKDERGNKQRKFKTRQTLKNAMNAEDNFIGPPAESHRFIATAGGTVIHESQNKMKKSLENVGIQGVELKDNNVVKGTAYQLPNGV